MNTKTKNPELIILSDLHGLQNSPWISLYVKALKNEFEISVVDACELAAIDPNEVKEKRHQEFIQGGIRKAVDNLRIQKHPSTPFLMGFSIGGTIAWKAVQLGMPNKALFAISATRLRYERSKPHTYLHLYFGKEDPFKPAPVWFDDLALTPQIMEGNHEFYRHKAAQRQIVSDLLKEKAALS